MNYVQTKWHHTDPDDPIEIYGELDTEGWEVRKVEIFRDGKMTFASEVQSSGDSWLAETPWPPIAEINQDPQFEARPINQAEFEQVWTMAVTHGLAVSITLKRDLATQLESLAWQQGLPLEKLIDGWLHERLAKEQVLT